MYIRRLGVMDIKNVVWPPDSDVKIVGVEVDFVVGLEEGVDTSVGGDILVGEVATNEVKEDVVLKEGVGKGHLYVRYVVAVSWNDTETQNKKMEIKVWIHTFTAKKIL